MVAPSSASALISSFLSHKVQGLRGAGKQLIPIVGRAAQGRSPAMLDALLLSGGLASAARGLGGRRRSQSMGAMKRLHIAVVYNAYKDDKPELPEDRAGTTDL